MSDRAITHDGPFGSPTLNLIFSDDRTVSDIEHMVMFLLVPI